MLNTTLFTKPTEPDALDVLRRELVPKVLRLGQAYLQAQRLRSYSRESLELQNQKCDSAGD